LTTAADTRTGACAAVGRGVGRTAMPPLSAAWAGVEIVLLASRHSAIWFRRVDHRERSLCPEMLSAPSRLTVGELSGLQRGDRGAPEERAPCAGRRR